MKTVFIIDTNYPEDHYHDRADGTIAQHILKAIGITADFRLAMNEVYLKKSIRRALAQKCDVIHLSCHGDDDGIGICDGSELSWEHFADLFQAYESPPKALVMSSCRGAADGIKNAFENVPKRPTIIVGTTADKYPADYVAAWALLYRDFKRNGIDKGTAQEALKNICAVVDESFRYLRWDDTASKYLRFPGVRKKYEVIEKTLEP
jgi:hypothetical protein